LDASYFFFAFKDNMVILSCFENEKD